MPFAMDRPRPAPALLRLPPLLLLLALFPFPLLPGWPDPLLPGWAEPLLAGWASRCWPVGRAVAGRVGRAVAGRVGRAVAGVQSAGRLERRGDQLGRHPPAVVLHADDYLGGGRFGRGGDVDAGARRVVAERVVQQVDENLLHPVVVGPHDGQLRVAAERDRFRAARRQAGDRGLDHQPDVAPVPLQPHDARFDRGKVEQVIDQPAEARGLRGDPVQEALLGVAGPRSRPAAAGWTRTP